MDSEYDPFVNRSNVDYSMDIDPVDPVDPFMDPPMSYSESINSMLHPPFQHHGQDVEISGVRAREHSHVYHANDEVNTSFDCNHHSTWTPPSSHLSRSARRRARYEASTQQRLATPGEPTHTIPSRHRIPDRLLEPYQSTGRIDLNARNNLRALISSIILSETDTAPERASLLEDCAASAEESGLGIPFSELISEPMDTLDVSPLMYELLRCEPDWDGINDDATGTGLEVVLFLVERWKEDTLVHGSAGSLLSVVRRSCLRRADGDAGNRLFQRLGPVVANKTPNVAHFDYDLTITSLSRSRGFHVFISLSDAEGQFQRALNSSYGIPPREPRSLASAWECKRHSLTAQENILIEFLAEERAWSLKLGTNTVKLSLLEGPRSGSNDGDEDVDVDARVRLVAPADTNYNSPELLFRRSKLKPLAMAGLHAVALSPAFSPSTVSDDYEVLPRGFDDPRFLHEGMLLLELTVELGPVVSSSRAQQENAEHTEEGVRSRSIVEDDLIDLYESDPEFYDAEHSIEGHETLRVDERAVDKGKKPEVDVSRPHNETTDAPVSSSAASLIASVSNASGGHVMAIGSPSLPTVPVPKSMLDLLNNGTPSNYVDREREESRNGGTLSDDDDEWDNISETETIDDSDTNSGWVKASWRDYED